MKTFYRTTFYSAVALSAVVLLLASNPAAAQSYASMIAGDSAAAPARPAATGAPSSPLYPKAAAGQGGYSGLIAPDPKQKSAAAVSSYYDVVQGSGPKTAAQNTSDRAKRLKAQNEASAKTAEDARAAMQNQNDAAFQPLRDAIKKQEAKNAAAAAAAAQQNAAAGTAP